jgi:hypothetical protein
MEALKVITLQSSITVLNNGKSSGISVLILKESIMRGIKF